MSYKEIQKMYKAHALWNTKIKGSHTISISEFKGTNPNISSSQQTTQIWTHIPKKK